MTSAASLLDPAVNAEIYLVSVLGFYADMPDTPLRTNIQDQRQARRWFDNHVPLSLVETALLLASLRRKIRPADVPPLSPVRSLAYFQPVVDELLENPVPPEYTGYLRLKLRSITDRTTPANVQKTTFPRDR